MEAPAEVLKVAQLIKDMRVRGAGRIARAAAYAMKAAAQSFRGRCLEEFHCYMLSVADVLGSTRPTAVSLHNASRFVLSRVKAARILEEAVELSKSAADEFIARSLTSVKVIGEIGARLLEDGDVTLTHCNSSATLSVVKTAHKMGKRVRVYTTETRPKFQGFLSYRELRSAGVPVTMIPDSAIRYFMKDVDLVIVGADTVAANGAVVNKIGTSMIALAAHEARVRVYVATETYKFSPFTLLGELVAIEERGPEEVVARDVLQRFPNLKVRNPVFDVTPPEYVTGIVTELGLIPPKAAAMVLRRHYGTFISEELARIPVDLEEGVEVAGAVSGS